MSGHLQFFLNLRFLTGTCDTNEQFPDSDVCRHGQSFLYVFFPSLFWEEKKILQEVSSPHEDESVRYGRLPNKTDVDGNPVSHEEGKNVSHLIDVVCCVGPCLPTVPSVQTVSSTSNISPVVLEVKEETRKTPSLKEVSGNLNIMVLFSYVRSYPSGNTPTFKGHRTLHDRFVYTQKNRKITSSTECCLL
jgi:hypothetical protein